MSVNWNTIPREDLRPFLVKNNWMAYQMLICNWGLIALSFALVLWQPAWFSIAIAMIILGGRQLGLGILTHECAHRSFMQSSAMGEWIGTWLCGAAVFVDLETYRRYHMTHHVKTGTSDDPDLANYANYPVHKISLVRKFIRDLFGLSGLKAMLGLIFLYAQNKDDKNSISGYSYKKYKKPYVNVENEEEKSSNQLSICTLIYNLRRIVLVNALMFALLSSLHHPLLYLLWPVSWLTTYMVFSRIRNVAEHGALAGTRSADTWSNTRTGAAAWWERLTVAPNFVNFHFEHHLAPTVPSYNLPALHRFLKSQGVYERAVMELGYLQILRRMYGE